MPELPEVETIRLGLNKKITGLKIKKIQILNPKTFQGNPRLVIGEQITSVWRRAKMLGVDLEDGLILLFHLKMSGQLVFVDGKKRFIGGHPTQDMAGLMPNKSTRVIFEFSDGSKLYFNDQRKFGWVKVVNNDQLSMNNLFKDLGPEPLDKSFSWQILKQNLLRRKNVPIKAAIMDQAIISGVGNIYANEACFVAKLDPRTKVNSLSNKDFRNLYQGIIRSLKDGIKYGGSSRAHFVNEVGERGLFLDYAFVYGRDKKPCKKCKTKIEKIQLGGRGTFYCPKCQHFIG